MFEKKYKNIKLFVKDALFIENLAKKEGKSVAEIMAGMIEVIRKEAQQEEEEKAQRKAELEDQLKLLIPYLGEPDTIVDGEPGWTGIKYKQALKQFLLENDPESYEEYRDELDDI